MIRKYDNRLVAVEGGNPVNVSLIFCNSEDTKPTTELANGSGLIEVDTGKAYLFDEAGGEWVEIPNGILLDTIFNEPIEALKPVLIRETI